MESEKKRVGRPSKGATPMTNNERAYLSRRRSMEAAGVAHEHLSTASVAALLAGLKSRLKALDAPPDDYTEVARLIAGRMLAELCERYEIKLDRDTAPKKVS